MRWSYLTGGGIQSSPALGEGLVVVGSDDGYLHALDAATGAGVWRVRTGGPVTGSPAIVDDTVYAGGGDGQVYALGRTTGEIRWRHETGVSINGSVAVAGSRVFVATSNGLSVLDARDGSVLWTAFFDGSITTPGVVDDLVYLTDTGGTAYALDVEDGDEAWRFTTGGGIYAGVAVAEDIVVFESDDENLYGVNATDGFEEWRFPAGGGFDNVPSIAGGIVYAGDPNGNLLALDIASGTERWRFRTATGERFREPVVTGGMVFTVGTDGNLYALAAAAISCPGGQDSTPSAEAPRYVIVNGPSPLLAAPASETPEMTLAEGTFVEGSGTPVFTVEGTWWPVREPRSGTIGYVLEASLQPVHCQAPLSFDPPTPTAPASPAAPPASPPASPVASPMASPSS